MNYVWLAHNFAKGVIAVCRTQEKAREILWDNLNKDGIPQEELDMIHQDLYNENHIQGYGEVIPEKFYNE